MESAGRVKNEGGGEHHEEGDAVREHHADDGVETHAPKRLLHDAAVFVAGDDAPQSHLLDFLCGLPEK